MTKRITQTSTVTVPATVAHVHGGAAPAAANAVADAEAKAEIVVAKADKADVKEVPAAEVVMAVAAPAPLAMVEAAALPAAAAAAAAQDASTSEGSSDYTPYIIGGVLLAGGIAAVALSGGDDNSPTPTPTPTPTNTAPTFAAATATATSAENVAITATVFTAVATDAQAQAITYTLGGTDAALFAINATTGAVTFRASPNFEATPTKTSYSFTVIATDSAGLASTPQTVTLNLTNVNEAPVITSAATATIAENTPITTAVYTAAATDVDAGTVLTYSISGTDAALFAINATTGVVTLRAPADFETKASYSFSVTATDNAATPLSAIQAVVLSVTNVNEAPTFATPTAVATAINENVAAGATVFTAAATDRDAGAVITYSLTGADAARFAINATTGVVSLIASPDFETKSSYAFNVVATDQGGLFNAQGVTLAVNDLPEGTVLVGVQNLAATPGNIAYTESAATANTSTITSFTAGDTITVDVPTSSYSFFNNGADLVISFANNGVANQITLVGAVATNAFVFNEFTAEQAIGSDFFKSTVVVTPPPAAANTIDGAGSVATYNAANAAVTYTENAGVGNNTTISNFTADDRIVVQGATSGYTFFNAGTDLIIQFANNGVTNQITLTGAVGANQFVFNEATAEAAVGADFFRYA